MKTVAEVLASISDSKEMQQLLQELLTEKELDALQLRWELMRQLKEGKTQREIARDLHVSLCKVTRGNKILKDTNSVTNRMLNKEYHDE